MSSCRAEDSRGRLSPLVRIYFPTPNKLNTCGPGSLSVTVTSAERPPVAEGVKVMVIVQLEPAASVLVHVFVVLKSLTLGPLVTIFVRLTSLGPKLERVALIIMLVPTICCPKPMLGGDSATVVCNRIGTSPLENPPTARSSRPSPLKS